METRVELFEFLFSSVWPYVNLLSRMIPIYIYLVDGRAIVTKLNEFTHIHNCTRMYKYLFTQSFRARYFYYNAYFRGKVNLRVNY